MKNYIPALAAILLLWSCQKENSSNKLVTPVLPANQQEEISNYETPSDVAAVIDQVIGTDSVTFDAPWNSSMSDDGTGRAPCYIGLFSNKTDTCYFKMASFAFHRDGNHVTKARLYIDGIRIKTILNIPDTASNIYFFRRVPFLIDPNININGKHGIAMDITGTGPNGTHYSVTLDSSVIIYKPYGQFQSTCPVSGLPRTGRDMYYDIP